MAAKFAIVGLCAAPFTPFKDDAARSVDFESIRVHAEELVRQGVFYAFVNGTTGEGVTMSVPERKAVLEAWLTAAGALAGPEGQKLQIIAHVGSEAIADVLDLAAHADAAGAAAVAAHTPSFNKPPSLASIVDFLAAISAAAPRLPLYYYHIAIKTGVNIRCDKLLEAVSAAGDRVRTFRGIKYTDFDLHILSNCLAFEGGKYDILSGRDEVLLGALAMGVKGAVGSTYNYMGRVYNSLIAAFNSGDIIKARALQRDSQLAVNLLMSDAYGVGVNIGKAILELRLGGKHTGPPRYPGAPMTAEAKAKLHTDLEALGFFAW